jgi:hypothetical protein
VGNLSLFIGFVLIGSGLGVARPAHQPSPPASPVPFSWANMVLAHTAAPADSVLNALVAHLQQAGYTLDTVDRARGLVTTKVELQSAYRQGNVKIRAIRLATGTDWKFIGTYVIEAYGSGVAYPAEFRGAESMPATINFRMVEQAAKAVPRGTLRYARSKVPFGVMTKLDVALQSIW